MSILLTLTSVAYLLANPQIQRVETEVSININELPYQKLYAILENIKSIPAEKINLTNCDLETFEMLFENYLCEDYPMATFVPNNVDTYVLYHKNSKNVLENSLNFNHQNRLESSPFHTYDNSNLIYIMKCADTSAGVSSRADTHGNKEVKVDISSTSDDGKYSVKASATYEEDKHGEKTGSAQVEARINFGGK